MSDQEGPTVTEADIQRSIVEYLRARGALVLRMNAGRTKHNVHLAPPGTPDLLVVEPHRLYWVEVKAEKGKLNEDQKKMHEQLGRYGQEVIVARSVEDVEGM